MISKWSRKFKKSQNDLKQLLTDQWDSRWSADAQDNKKNLIWSKKKS